MHRRGTMVNMEPVAWTVTARNLADHAGNAIHTDAGARAAGFPGALVAGVTTYAYLTHPIVEAWGVDWLASGTAEIRFRSPVFDRDLLELRPAPRVDGGVLVEAVRSGSPEPLATMVARRPVIEPPAGRRPGEELEPTAVILDGQWGSDYGWRAGDDLSIYAERGVVHPAAWPALANHITHAQVVRGSWIHTRSLIRHHALAPVGAAAFIRATVIDRFTRPAGERAVLDVTIDVEGIRVATIEHEAIVAVTRTDRWGRSPHPTIRSASLSLPIRGTDRCS